MNDRIKYYKCYDQRRDCMAMNGGGCIALNETYPSNVKCPFYKNITQYRLEIERLKAKENK